MLTTRMEDAAGGATARMEDAPCCAADRAPSRVPSSLTTHVPASVLPVLPVLPPPPHPTTLPHVPQGADSFDSAHDPTAVDDDGDSNVAVVARVQRMLATHGDAELCTLMVRVNAQMAATLAALAARRVATSVRTTTSLMFFAAMSRDEITRVCAQLAHAEDAERLHMCLTTSVTLARTILSLAATPGASPSAIE